MSQDESLASLREAARGDGITKMFDYSDGCTEFGEVVTVRPSNNPRCCRIIVNEGTPDYPHCRVIKGGDLCPGGAEAMCDEEAGDQHTIFDLLARRRGMKTPGYISDAGPCVVFNGQGFGKHRPDCTIDLGAGRRRPEL